MLHNYNFFKLYIKNEIKAHWPLHVLFVVFVCLVLPSAVLSNSYFSILLNNVALSYIAAYIFYCMLDLYADYKREKNAFTIKQSSLQTIVNFSTEFISIFRCFSDENYISIVIPDRIVYFKYNKGKTYFNPRLELCDLLQRIKKIIEELNRSNYFELPYELNIELNILTRYTKDLLEKLKGVYDCLDKHYHAQLGITEFSECIDAIGKACRVISLYTGALPDYQYTLLTEMEEQNYKSEIVDIMASFSQQLQVHLKGRVYKGGTRIR